MSKNILNIAVVGCSNMAKLHMNGIKAREGANLYAICDNDPDVLAKRQEEMQVEKTCTDYRDLVNDPKVDAVVLVVPDQVHLEMTVAFLRAGKAVLCEKPFALTVEECLEMIKVEKETDGKLMVGQICRCTPGFIKAKELVDAGRIGELIFVESEYAHNYSDARGARDWRVDPARHIVIGGGCHAIDLLRWIAGDPTEVYGHHNHKGLVDWPTCDTAVAVYKFPNNVMGKVFVSSGCKRDYTMRTVLYGTMGTIICDNTSDYITLYEDSATTEYYKGQKIDVRVDNHNCTAEIDAFVTALINNEPMPVSSMEGTKTVIVCCASVQSMNEHRVIEIEYPEA